MHSLGFRIKAFERMLLTMVDAELFSLNHALRHVSTEQTSLACNILERSEIEQKYPDQFRFLAFVLSHWRMHGLATRLAVMDCIFNLANIEPGTNRMDIATESQTSVFGGVQGRKKR